jgi:hypothetical protein
MNLINKISKFLQRINYILSRLRQDIDDLKLLNGKLLSRVNSNDFSEIIKNIHLAEFRVFSQWGDDGIIQFLVSYLDIPVKSFIEFGVEDYNESNTRFLLINNNWKGLVFDGDESNIKSIQGSSLYWQYDLTAKHIFITKENINKQIIENGFSGELGILHIDIDGNDYWIWKEISSVDPIIVIVEYNSVFGVDRAISVPYDPAFIRSDKHFSDLYFGASLKALVLLSESKGYGFIGCNSNGNNAYFVRKDKMKNLISLKTEEGFVESRFREGKDEFRKLTYISGSKRIEFLRGLSVINVETEEFEVL